ncbi:hypothetical protein UCD39_21195 [Nitrospirillum sp. BR 11752]|uniref:hypothetical protein n=1 Tax=Nitrospirillum sp. BR 11752 TaxID=3104293 RepID=UPI002EAEA062|nr:hypothetical protein [Nitrospirillum sp. BR 11752]
MHDPIPLSAAKTLRAEKSAAAGEERGWERLPGIPLVEEERLGGYARSLGHGTVSEILVLYAECLVDAGAALEQALQEAAPEAVRHYAYLLTGTAAEMGTPRLAHISRFLARRATQGVAEAEALGSLRQVLAHTQTAVSDFLDRHIRGGQGQAVRA